MSEFLPNNEPSDSLPSSNLPVPQPHSDDQAEREYQQTARGRLTAFPLAVGFITLGVLLLLEGRIEGFDVTLPVAILIMAAALVLTHLFRFFISGRRERGLLFLALVILTLGGVLALFSVAGDHFDPYEWWPLALVGTSAALFMTFVLERQHERGLVGLSILILVAAGVALLVTHEVISPKVTDQVADFWPLAIAFIGITLIPLTLRRSAE